MENKCVTHLKPCINCLLCFFVCVLGLWRGCDKEKKIMMSKWNALRWIPDCCLVIFFLTSLPMCACHDCWTYADTQNDKVYRSKRSKIPMIVRKSSSTGLWPKCPAPTTKRLGDWITPSTICNWPSQSVVVTLFSLWCFIWQIQYF